MKDLNIKRGASKRFKVKLTNKAGAPYQIQNDEFICFGVKKTVNDTEYLVKKVYYEDDYESSTGTLYVSLSPKDTMNLPFGNYTYDIGLQRGNDYYYITDPCRFTVAKRVTAWEVEE